MNFSTSAKCHNNFFQMRMVAGGENFIYDKDILNEGFKKHSTP